MKILELEIESCRECHYHRNAGVLDFCVNVCHPKYNIIILSSAINLTVKQLDSDCPLAKKNNESN